MVETLASAYKAVNDSNDIFDVVIVDEAGAATVSQTLLALVLGKKFILIGDHRQLPPVVSAENCSDWVRESLFEKLWRMYPQKCNMLHEQYRMDSQISDIVSDMIYRDLGGIKTSESVKNRSTPFENVKVTKNLDPYERKLINKAPICWVDSSGSTEWINFSNSNSAKNDREVENIDKLLEILVEDARIDPKTIGVLSPFRYQISTMVKALKRFIERGVSVNTIHSFQGNEKDVIIISIVAKQSDDSRIFDDVRLLNVALTRAKFKLMIVSDINMIKGSDKTSEIMSKLFKSARENDAYVAKNKLNISRNEEIRKDTITDLKIADTQKFLMKERNKIQFYRKH